MAHSIFHGRWSWSKFRQTPIASVWPTVLLCALWSVVIWCIEERTDYTVQLPATFLSGTVGTILAFSIGLLTSGASAQYNEGRCLWTKLQTTSSQLAQHMWFHIIDRRDVNGGPASASTPMDADGGKRLVAAQVEKISIINLIGAYTISLKHALRDEPGVYYTDLYPLIAWLPHFGGSMSSNVTEADWMPLWASSRASEPGDGRRPSMVSRPRYASSRPQAPQQDLEKGTTRDLSWMDDPRQAKGVGLESILPIVGAEYPLLPAHQAPEGHWSDHTPITACCVKLFCSFGRRGCGSAQPRSTAIKQTPSVVPLAIHSHIQAYFDFALASGIIRAPYDGMIAGGLCTLLTVGDELCRIRETPIPFAYRAHLWTATVIYFIIFPLNSYETFGWAMVPAAALLAYIYFGLLSIARDMQNPFGYDPNDLPLDAFVCTIMHKLTMITAYDTSTATQKYLISSYNKPFAPADPRSAKEISQGSQYDSLVDGAQQLQRTLLNRWLAVRNVVVQRMQGSTEAMV